MDIESAPPDNLVDRVSDKAYERLRRLIISLELEPGTHLSDAHLMVRLGCGRTPLREALQRLKEEGLVVGLPRRPMAVTDITVNDLKRIYEARWYLEPAIGRAAAPQITDLQLDCLQGLLDRTDAGKERLTSFEMTELDMAFHRGIAEATGNRYLVAAFDCISGLAQRLSVLAYSRAPVVAPTIEEHRRILQSLRARDPERIAAALDEHIHGAKDRILKTV